MAPWRWNRPQKRHTDAKHVQDTSNGDLPREKNPSECTDDHDKVQNSPAQDVDKRSEVGEDHSPRPQRSHRDMFIKGKSQKGEHLEEREGAMSGRAAKASSRSNKSDSSVNSISSAASAVSSVRKLETVKHMKASGSIGLSTDRFILDDGKKKKKNTKTYQNMLAQYSPYHSKRGSSISENNHEDIQPLENEDNKHSACFPLGIDNQGWKREEHLSNESVRKEKDLPAHLHGAPTINKIKHAIRKFQNMRYYDSQNFEHSDSNLDRRAALNLPRKYFVFEEMVRWLLVFSIGVTMGVVSFLISWAIEALIKVRHENTELYIQKGMGGSAIAFYMCLGVGLALCAALPVAFIAPTAAGSGFAEMKVYLNGIHISGLLRLTTFVIKSFSLICAIPAGLFLGTAGPFVHIGGIVGGGIGSLGSKMFKFKLNSGYLDFQTQHEHRNFTTIGIATGLATIFTAPIGGVLAAYEDCGGFQLASTKMFWQCFLATCTGVYINYLLQLSKNDNGNIMYDSRGVRRAFALYTDDMTDYSEVYRYTWWEVFIFGLMGSFAGLVGTCFVNAHIKIMRMRQKYIASPVKRVTEVVVIALITVTISLLASYFSECKPLPKDIELYPMTDANGNNPNFPQLWCPGGSYSVYGIFFFDPITMSLRRLMHLGSTIELDSEFEWSLLLVFMCVSFLLLIVTYSCSVPGGVLVPTLAIGACYGRLVARLVELALADQSESVTSFATYAVIGAACMLSGVTRMTLSITVLVMETTGSLQLTIPMMIAIFFAKIFGDITGIGLYDAYIELKGVPFLPEVKMNYEHKMLSEKLDAQEIMTSDLVYLPLRPSVRRVLNVLKSCEHNVFPIVVDDIEALYEAGDRIESKTESNILGSISRAQLINMLEKRIAFVKERDTFEVSDALLSSVRESLSLIPLKKDVKDQDMVFSSLRDVDQKMHMDLSQFIQLDPHIISADANVSKAYRLFQNMGLSHLFVAPSGAKPIVGIITRKDLTLENCKLQLGERAAFEMKLLETSQRSAQDSHSV